MKKKRTAKKKSARSRRKPMYVYLYDSFVTERKYQAQLARRETRIAQLGLRGRIEKLSILKNVEGIVRDARRQGADTLVVVGNDRTVLKVVSDVAKARLTLGLLPVGQEQRCAELFGIPAGEAACEVLSRRVIRSLDLGRVNSAYFLFSLEVPEAQAQLECDNEYVVSPLSAKSSITINNCARIGAIGNPQDGVLEAVVTEPTRRSFPFFAPPKPSTRGSVFPLRKVKIHSPSQSLSLLLDGQTVVKTPATVEVAPHMLRVIVGRDRRFP